MKINWEEVVIVIAVLIIASTLTAWGPRDLLKFGERSYPATTPSSGTTVNPTATGIPSAFIKVYVDSPPTITAGGSAIAVDIWLENTSSVSKITKASTVYVKYDSSKLTATFPAPICGPDFPDTQRTLIEDSLVQITCWTSPTTGYAIAPGNKVKLATFNLTAVSGTSGPTVLSIDNAQVVEKTSYALIGYKGNYITLNILP